MRICIVGKVPPIQGGTAISTFLAAKSLVDLGHEVHVLSNDHEAPASLSNYFLTQDYNFKERSGVVFHAPDPPAGIKHIPYSNSYLERILGALSELRSRVKFDLLVGWYLHPYGTATLLSKCLDPIPVFIRHAGSDIGRLSQHKDLRSVFRMLLPQADKVITSELSQTKRILNELGVSDSQMIKLTASPIPDYFRTSSAQVDQIKPYYDAFPAFISATRHANFTQPKLASRAIKVGLYGKIGRYKGTTELLEVLTRHSIAELKDLELHWCAAADDQSYAAFANRVAAANEAGAKIVLVPPLPPWRIPYFIDEMDAILYLENGFPISFHSPKIPTEVRLRATALVTTPEIVAKQAWKDSACDNRNIFIVPPPFSPSTLLQTLLRVVDSGKNLRDVGFRYRSIVIDPPAPTTNPIGALIDEQLKLLTYAKNRSGVR